MLSRLFWRERTCTSARRGAWSQTSNKCSFVVRRMFPGGPYVQWLHAVSEAPTGGVFGEMNKQVEFMMVTEIFIVRGDPTANHLSSYNAIVIASVLSGCQSPAHGPCVVVALTHR